MLSSRHLLLVGRTGTQVPFSNTQCDSLKTLSMCGDFAAMTLA